MVCFDRSVNFYSFLKGVEITPHLLYDYGRINPYYHCEIEVNAVWHFICPAYLCYHFFYHQLNNIIWIS